MQQGDKMNFHAGASGIGTASIQLANVFDCESFVTAGTEEKIKFCLNLGASDGEIRSNDIFFKDKVGSRRCEHLFLTLLENTLKETWMCSV